MRRGDSDDNSEDSEKDKQSSDSYRSGKLYLSEDFPSEETDEDDLTEDLKSDGSLASDENIRERRK